MAVQPERENEMEDTDIQTTDTIATPKPACWHRTITSIALQPEGSPLYSEEAYVVSIEDEAAGGFVVLRDGCDSNTPSREVRIEADDMEHVVRLLEEMAEECREYNKQMGK
jgi:hypothetical protein